LLHVQLFYFFIVPDGAEFVTELGERDLRSIEAYGYVQVVTEILREVFGI
jgi:hypothetical protein